MFHVEHSKKRGLFMPTILLEEIKSLLTEKLASILALLEAIDNDLK